jgi:hypothetical protein
MNQCSLISSIPYTAKEGQSSVVLLMFGEAYIILIYTHQCFVELRRMNYEIEK